MQNSTAYNGTMQQTKKGGFKLHTKEDYREFFTRGMAEDCGLSRVRPWMYLRVFAACFILFSFVAFVTGITGNHNSYPFVFLLGGVLLDLPFLTLLYELNPKRDLNILMVFLIMLIGGASSVSLAELLYMAVPNINNWGLAALAGTLEEVVKIIPVVVAILILKKRDPVTCLIIGAAVGTGFSVIENMGYIFYNSSFIYYDEELNSFFEVMAIGQAIFIAIFRGITVASGHTFWAAFEGWAFGKFRAKFGFWGICLSCMTMHFLWDLSLPFSDYMSEEEPLSLLTLILTIIMLFIMAALTAIAIVVLVVLIKRGRKEVLGVQSYGPPKEKCKRCGKEIDLFSKFCTACGAKIERAFPPVQIAIPLTQEEMRIISAKNAAQAAERERVRMYESSLQTANLSAVICALVLCVFLLLMVSIFNIITVIACSIICGAAFITGLVMYIVYKVKANGYKNVK